VADLVEGLQLLLLGEVLEVSWVPIPYQHPHPILDQELPIAQVEAVVVGPEVPWERCLYQVDQHLLLHPFLQEDQEGAAQGGLEADHGRGGT